MGKKRYSEEFKKQAIDLMVEGGKTAEEVGKSLGVSVWSLKQWRKTFLRENQDDLRRRGKMTAEEQLKILRRENAELRMDNEILKKFAAILSKEKK
jgi:transposase